MSNFLLVFDGNHYYSHFKYCYLYWYCKNSLMKSLSRAEQIFGLQIFHLVIICFQHFHLNCLFVSLAKCQSIFLFKANANINDLYYISWSPFISGNIILSKFKSMKIISLPHYETIASYFLNCSLEWWLAWNLSI